MFKLILLGLLVFIGNADSLVFKKGEVKAHTGIFGDSNIEPISHDIISYLTMNKSFESIKGMVSIHTLTLESEKKDRDENMYELLENTTFPTISFKITNTVKENNAYIIKGILDFHGVQKEVSSLVNIVQDNNSIVLDGNFSIKLTQFNLEPPSLLFFTVRDKIDINYTLYYDIK